MFQQCDEEVLNQTYAFNYSSTLGKGSFGTVYKGRVLSSGQSVAIKAIDRSLLQEQKQTFLMDQLRKEITLMQKLECEHIVRILDLVGTDSHIYIILEFCAMGDLRTLLNKKNYHLSESQAVYIMNDILKGIKSMILQGYVHRDIKPENILISTDYTFKIADFGFATSINDHDINAPVLKECVGSLFYMSPQLLQQKQYSSKSDVWSIGILFFELLFGKLPWISRDMKSLLIQIRKVPLRFPFETSISSLSKDFIKGCLQFEEKKRFAWEQIFNHDLLQRTNGLDDKKMVKLLLEEVETNQKEAASLKTNREETKPKDDKDDNINAKDFNENNNIKEVIKLKKIKETSANNIKIKQNNQPLTDLSDPNRQNHHIQQGDVRIIPKDESAMQNKEALTIPNQVHSKHKENQKNIVNDNFSPIVQKEYEDCSSILSEREKNIIMLIKEVVQFYRVSVRDLFNRFDRDRDDLLRNKDFYNLVRKLDQQATLQQSAKLFSIYGRQEQKEYMTYKEFESMLTDVYPSGLEDSTYALLHELRLIVSQTNINISEIFQPFESMSKNNGNLSLQEFEKIIKKISPNINAKDISAIFMKFDSKREGVVNLQKLKNEISRKVLDLYDTDNMQANRVILILKELKSVLLSKKISPSVVFNNFTKKSPSSMKIGQLTKLARILDESVDESSINMLFKYIDIDCNGEISLQEFEAALEL